jgi:uncharacterized protein YjiS (DUF1127 family)
MHWYRLSGVNQVSIDDSYVRHQIDQMVARALPVFSREKELAATDIDLRDYENKLRQALGSIQDQFSKNDIDKALSNILTSASSLETVNEAREGITQLMSNIAHNKRKEWMQYREVYRLLSDMDDHLWAKEMPPRQSVEQQLEDYRIA